MNKEQNMIATHAQDAEMEKKEISEKELENVSGGGLWNIFLPPTLLNG